jgi:cytochrome P450
MVGTERLARGSTPRASVPDTMRVAAGLLVPLVGRGVIVRRPKVVDAAERMGADARAVRLVQELRDRYGDGPLQLSVPGKSFALVLSPADARRVLAETPVPFATATLEKRAALSHFQPEGVLVSHGAERADRRRFNEQVLEPEKPVHDHGARMLAIVREEAEGILAGVERVGSLTWGGFVSGWWRVVRRVVLGDAARDDHELTELLGQLRSDANWSYLRPSRSKRRDEFLRRLEGYVDRAEPGSLAALVASVPSTGSTSPVQQIPQWLFAFDPAGMTTFRALALVATHPEAARAARDEAGAADLSTPTALHHLQACVLESLRLWPTTPAILRETTEETHWDTGTLPEGTGIMVFAPFFHRDDQRMEDAHRFAPELWSDGSRSQEEWPLVPFSDGPGFCPGRSIVLLTTSTMLAALLQGREWRMDRAERLDPSRPLPGTFSPYTTSFTPVR